MVFPAHRHFLRLLLLFLGSELLRQSLSIQGPRGSSAGTKRLGSGSERPPGTRLPTQDPETRRTQPGRRHITEGGVRPRGTKESARRGWDGGGLCWSRGCPAFGSRGQSALSAAAPAGSCSWSGGVWSRRGECVGKPGWGWEMPVPQQFPRGPDLRSWRALPWEPSLAWGRDPTQNHFPAPAPFRSETGETLAPQPSSAPVWSLLATGSSAGPRRDMSCPFSCSCRSPSGDPRIPHIPSSHFATDSPFVSRCL